MHIALRTISEKDLEFRWRLHNAALRSYIESTWGWDEVWQRQHFIDEFDPSKGTIITVDGVDAGYWSVIEYDDDVMLVSIHLLPEFQNLGIGSRVITDLLKTEKPVRLQVLKVNPARTLYERLGFEVFEETETHFKMVRR